MIRFIKQLFRARPVFSNTAEGIHAGLITRTLESAVAVRHLLGKTGGSASQVSPCGANESPLGVITGAGAPGDAVNVNLLATSPTTVLMVASVAIAAGEDVYTAAGGKIQNQPIANGTYYQVGRAVTAATGDNAVLEVEPCAPRKLIAMDALSGNGNTDVISLAAVLEQAPDKIVVLPSA